MKSHSVLIVSGGGFQGLSLIKAMRAVPGTRILIADCYPENVSRYFADAFFHAPLLKKTQAFLDFLIQLCEQEEVKTIFASTSLELDLLSSEKAAFNARGITVYVSDKSLLDIAHDKLLFYQWLHRENLSCLPCYSSPQDQGVIFPLIGKPRNSWGSRGVCVLDSQASTKPQVADQLDNYVWQPCLQDFDEYSVDFSVDVSGHISPLAFRRRIRTLSGLAILCEPGAPQPVRDLAQLTIERLVPMGALGPMNLQILQFDDRCWVSDLNPRVGTSMPLSLTTGLNPISFLLGGDKTTVTTPANTLSFRTLRYLEERCIPHLELEDVHSVVFDLDDTLLDQKDWIFNKLELTWTSEQALLPTRNEFLSHALRILEEGNRSRLIDALCQELALDDNTRLRLIDTYRKSKPDTCKVYDDVLPTLEQLRHMGYRIGLITDNPPASQKQKLEVCGFEHLFDALLLTGELEMRKPDKRVFIEIARRMGVTPDQSIMVGDNLFRDIRGALSSGYRQGFHIQRSGAFFNFNLSLAQNILDSDSSIYSIVNLNELTWYLEGVTDS